MHRPQFVLTALITAALLLGGCAETDRASHAGSTAPTSSADLAAPSVASSTAETTSPTPVPATDPLPVPTTDPSPMRTTSRTTTSSTGSSQPRPADPLAPSDVSDTGGPVPPCGAEVPAITPGEPDATPAPDTCQFTGGSPVCPTQVMAVVESGTTRQVEPAAVSHPPILGGFGRWGGARGGSMCFTEFADQSVQMMNGDSAILVVHNDNAIVNADRIQLARSAGLRGIVSAGTATVTVRDPARPQGVEVELLSLGNGTGPASLPEGAKAVQVFVVPVSSGLATVTAYDSSGAELGSVTVP